VLEEALLLAMTVACLELRRGRGKGDGAGSRALFPASLPEKPCSRWSARNSGIEPIKLISRISSVSAHPFDTNSAGRLNL